MKATIQQTLFPYQTQFYHGSQKLADQPPLGEKFTLQSPKRDGSRQRPHQPHVSNRAALQRPYLTLGSIRVAISPDPKNASFQDKHAVCCTHDSPEPAGAVEIIHFGPEGSQPFGKCSPFTVHRYSLSPLRDGHLMPSPSALMGSFSDSQRTKTYCLLLIV